MTGFGWYVDKGTAGDGAGAALGQCGPLWGGLFGVAGCWGALVLIVAIDEAVEGPKRVVSRVQKVAATEPRGRRGGVVRA